MVQEFQKTTYKYPEVKLAEENVLDATLQEEKKVGYGKYKDKVRYAKFKAKAGDAPMIIRGHFFDWDEDLSDQQAGWHHEMIMIYTDPALGYYKDASHDIDIPTREILALLKREGFEFMEVQKYGKEYTLFFKNVKEGVVYTLRSRGFDDIEGGRKVMALNLFKLED